MSEAIELSYLSGSTRIEVEHYYSDLGREWRTKISLTPSGSGTTFKYTVREIEGIVSQLQQALEDAYRLQNGVCREGDHDWQHDSERHQFVCLRCGMVDK